VVIAPIRDTEVRFASFAWTVSSVARRVFRPRSSSFAPSTSAAAAVACSCAIAEAAFVSMWMSGSIASSCRISDFVAARSASHRSRSMRSLPTIEPTVVGP
jgi:hypothetical protein